MTDSPTHSPVKNIPTSIDSRLWPIAIVSAFVLFAGFIFVNVFIMMNSKTDLVSATYYQEEIEFQKQIDKRNRTLENGKNIRCKINSDEGMMVIELPGSNTRTTGSLHFFRPANAEEDRTMNLKCDSLGTIVLPLAQFGKGSWILKADWKEGGQDWYDEVKLDLE